MALERYLSLKLMTVNLESLYLMSAARTPEALVADMKALQN